MAKWEIIDKTNNHNSYQQYIKYDQDNNHLIIEGYQLLHDHKKYIIPKSLTHPNATYYDSNCIGFHVDSNKQQIIVEAFPNFYKTGSSTKHVFKPKQYSLTYPTKNTSYSKRPHDHKQYTQPIQDLSFNQDFNWSSNQQHYNITPSNISFTTCPDHHDDSTNNGSEVEYILKHNNYTPSFNRIPKELFPKLINKNQQTEVEEEPQSKPKQDKQSNTIETIPPQNIKISYKDCGGYHYYDDQQRSTINKPILQTQSTNTDDNPLYTKESIYETKHPFLLLKDNLNINKTNSISPTAQNIKKTNSNNVKTPNQVRTTEKNPSSFSTKELLSAGLGISSLIILAPSIALNLPIITGISAITGTLSIIYFFMLDVNDQQINHNITPNISKISTSNLEIANPKNKWQNNIKTPSPEGEGRDEGTIFR